LTAYATRIGADWTFATGSSVQVSAFWKNFGVELSSGDTHTSSLALIDRHGYVRLVHRGVPAVGSNIPPSLASSLSAQGLKQLASGGDGWGAPDVLQELLTIAGPEQPSTSGGGKAPAFSLSASDGGKLTLAELAGKPAVINFWATYCPPCKTELPLLQRVSMQHQVKLVLVDEGDGPSAVRSFLSGIGINQASLLDADLSVGKAYGVFALPVTVFIKSDGTIAGRNIGQLDERVVSAQLSNLTTQ
jgi:thiol-disulfide isomerase/thioredoxin